MIRLVFKRVSKIGIFIVLIHFFSSCSVPVVTFDLFDFSTMETTVFFETEFVNFDSISHPINDGRVFNDDSFTFSFWVYPESNHNWSTLFSIGDENNFLILTTKGNPDGNDSGVNLSIRKSGGEILRVLSDKSNTVNLHRFNNIVITKNENNISLHLNGDLVAENTIGYELDYLSDFPLYIASKSLFDDPTPKGYISNITYSSEALSKESISEYYDKYYLATILELVDIDETDDLTRNIKLLNFENSRLFNDLYSLNWNSSNEDLISSDGILNHAYQLTHDEKVVLTLEISDGTMFATKEFFFTVRKETPELLLNRDVIFLENTISNIYSESDQLPIELPNGSFVKWSSNDQTVEIINNRIIKKLVSDDYLNITLDAKIYNNNKESIIRFPVLIVDEYKAYLMSYFDEIDYTHETMKLAYSFDGVNWRAINNSEAIIKPDIEGSSNRLRDPFIYRNTDGTFVVVGTQGWSFSSIYLIETPDLINFSNQRLVNLSYYDPGIQLSGERAWAPEVIFDNKDNSHIITFSDSVTGAIYYVRTKDFENFSYPNIFFDPNYTVIDQTVFKSKLGYWLFYKDERDGAKTIFHTYSKTLDFDNSFVFDQNFIHLQKNIEGPTVFSTIDEKKTILFFDNYKNERLFGVELELNDHNRFIPKSELKLALPQDRIRHPSVIKITEDELNKLLEHYN